jgi:hypothetical protein
VSVSAPMAKENMMKAPVEVVNCAVVYTKCPTLVPATVVRGVQVEHIVPRWVNDGELNVGLITEACPAANEVRLLFAAVFSVLWGHH